MKMQMERDSYQTSDIALASFLYCSGTELAEIDRQNTHRCVFLFEAPRPELISRWQEGKATVNALAFYNAYQALKARLYRGPP